MKEALREIVREVASAVVPAVLVCLTPALLIYLDVAVFRMICREDGIVELTQAGVLLSVSALLFFASRRRADLRGGLVLAVGFFMTMFVRENDKWLDFVFHGFWLCPALVVVVLSLWRAYVNRTTVLPAFLRICHDRFFLVLAIGLSLTVVFSRIFGMRPIWMAVVEADDYRLAKHVAEEGCELLGYFIVLFWAIALLRGLFSECRVRDSADSGGLFGE